MYPVFTILIKLYKVFHNAHNYIGFNYLLEPATSRSFVAGVTLLLTVDEAAGIVATEVFDISENSSGVTTSNVLPTRCLVWLSWWSDFWLLRTVVIQFAESHINKVRWRRSIPYNPLLRKWRLAFWNKKKSCNFLVMVQKFINFNLIKWFEWPLQE